jgi:hypothetical protein
MKSEIGMPESKAAPASPESISQTEGVLLRPAGDKINRKLGGLGPHGGRFGAGLR